VQRAFIAFANSSCIEGVARSPCLRADIVDVISLTAVNISFDSGQRDLALAAACCTRTTTGQSRATR
jgi:hypothetical protein